MSWQTVLWSTLVATAVSVLVNEIKDQMKARLAARQSRKLLKQRLLAIVDRDMATLNDYFHHRCSPSTLERYLGGTDLEDLIGKAERSLPAVVLPLVTYRDALDAYKCEPYITYAEHTEPTVDAEPIRMAAEELLRALGVSDPSLESYFRLTAEGRGRRV